MSSTHQFPPPSYSPLPDETERTLSPDADPPAPSYSPPSHEKAKRPIRKMSAAQFVTWLNAKGAFSPQDYQRIIDIPLWHKMAQRQLDGGSVLKLGLARPFWEEMVGTLEAERIVKLVDRGFASSGMFKSQGSQMDIYRRHRHNYYRRKRSIPEDVEVPESPLQGLGQDPPLWPSQTPPPIYRGKSSAQGGQNPGPHKRYGFPETFMRKLSNLLPQNRPTPPNNPG